MSTLTLKMKRFGLILSLMCLSYMTLNVFSHGVYCDHMRFNISNSLPYVMFLALPLKTLEREMYISFKPTEERMRFFKQIVGLPGDLITVKNQHVFVNDRDYGYLYAISESGFTLTPIAEGIIPEGFVFVHATHSQSFDSRYAEFGLVDIDKIEEQLWPLF